jgi:hypothetical protein
VNGGVAGLALFAPRLGERALTAVYKGDGRLFGSFSDVVTQKVVATAKPAITAITDVKGDQGKQVRLRFGRSPYDVLGSGTAIAFYHVYRQVNPFASPAAADPLGIDASPGTARATEPTATALAGWDYLASVPATTEDAYELVVPTLADSNASGFHRCTFLVRAATATPGVFYDSPADSGYSVDNLPPVPPAPFTAAYVGGATHLHWGASAEPDLWYYRVYRGSSAGFVPGPGNLIATPPDTGHVDVGAAGSYYKLSAVDVNGNESGYALVTPGGTVDVADGAPLAFSLEGVRPNPTRGSRLSVSFVLPISAPARLELLDVGGRRVAGQEVGALGAGRHSVELSAGRRLPPGLYLARLTQGDDVRVGRVAVID